MGINLQKIIEDLMASGMRQHEIAEVICCKQPQISRIYNGHQGTIRPSYSLVMRLTALHKRVFGETP